MLIEGHSKSGERIRATDGTLRTKAILEKVDTILDG